MPEVKSAGKKTEAHVNSSFETPCSNRFDKRYHTGTRERLTYRGKTAKDAILRRLTGQLKAQALAAEVCDFYGDYLQYDEDAGLDSSYYHIDLDHDPVSLRSARIELQLGTPRTAEALCHELLHLNTRIQGYPMGEKVWIPYELDRYARTICGIYPKIGNLLEHELIHKAFSDLGLDTRKFLASLSPPPDYRKAVSTALVSMSYRREVGFSWWCLEYFRHWISTRHWPGDEPAIYADWALYWGSKIHPEIKTTARKIRELIESGVLSNIRKHPYYVNMLLGLMKIPIFTHWALIRIQKDGKPLATPYQPFSC